MDFFEHQHRARQRSSLLLGYFCLAVLLTIVAVNTVFYVATRTWTQPGIGVGEWLAQPYGWFASVLTLGIIGGVSLFTWLSLREGGQVLAESVGARRIDPDTVDLQERTLLNLVEEMAIASGTPAPSTWVMDAETGINAFVAGFEPTEAVLVVTRGALDTFTRDEMQGVIGHEFSHILNGDMRMNVNLYAVLSGILAIGRIGEFLMRSAGGRRVGSRDNKGGAPVVLLGLALMVIGYIGLFFGRLIKAAISRQREWLADASSVQFTRNPRGIGEALLKIRNAGHGSLLDNAHAEDMSHMCFAPPVTLAFAALMATHPPLDARIAAIDPALLARDRARARGKGQESAPVTATEKLTNTDGSIAFVPRAEHAAAFAGTPPPAGPVPTPPALSGSTGQPTTGHLALAQRLHAGISAGVRDALRTPAGARAVCYAILSTETGAGYGEEIRTRIAGGDSAATAARALDLLPELRRMGTRLHLPCLDLALASLRGLTQDQKTRFLAVLATLAQLDQRLTLREYLLLSLLSKHLAADAGKTRPVRHRSYRSVAAPLNTVLSALCHAGSSDAEACAALHTRLVRGFGIGEPALLAATAITAGSLRAALAELADLTPLLKRPLLDACADGASHDGRLQTAEIELVRILGDTLDCPVPPWAGAA